MIIDYLSVIALDYVYLSQAQWSSQVLAAKPAEYAESRYLRS